MRILPDRWHKTPQQTGNSFFKGGMESVDSGHMPAHRMLSGSAITSYLPPIVDRDYLEYRHNMMLYWFLFSFSLIFEARI